MNKKDRLADEVSRIQAEFISKVIKIADECDVDRKTLVEVSIKMMDKFIPCYDFENWEVKDE